MTNKVQTFMASASETLTRAKHLHRTGKLQEAESFYKAVVSARSEVPEDSQLVPTAHYFLGVLCFQQGRLDDALENLQLAVEQRPDDADFLNYFGMVLEGKGRLEEAVMQFEKALAANPSKIEVYNNLGIVYRKLRRMEEAVECFRKVVAGSEPSPDAHNNLGNVYKDMRDWPEAVRHYRLAIALRPKYPEALANLAKVLEEQGELEEAIATWDQVLAVQPDHPAALSQISNIYLRQNRPAEAEEALQKLLVNQPSNATVHFHLGILAGQQQKHEVAWQHYKRAVELDPKNADAWNNFGSTMFHLKKHDEAIANYKQALEINFHHVDALFNLGSIYVNRKNWTEAERTLLKAIVLRPTHFAAFNSLGIVYGNLKRFDEASVIYRKAIEINPKFADAWSNLGVAMNELGRYEEAAAAFRKAIENDSQHADAHLNLGLTLLLLGEWSEAWREYAWRLKTRHLPMESLKLPGAHWTGEPLGGRTVLVHGEQGMGDLIQFARYAPLIVERGGKVILVAHPPLKSILKTIPGVSAVVVKGEQTPPYSCRTWVMNLPGIFDTRPNTIPDQVPYLFAEPAKVEDWAKRLPPKQGKLRIGLVWGGNPANKTNHKRSISLSDFVPLAKIPNLQVVSLQKGAAASQAVTPPSGVDWIDLTSQINDFVDTAALIMNLDLVVTVDTSVAHLAGALGKPVWTLITSVPDWRWLRTGDRTAWYPTMRLFRQPAAGDWASVVDQVVEALMKHSND